MNIRFLKVALLLIAGLVFTSSAVQAQSVRLLGDYRDWSAYTTSEGAGKLCFVLSKPKDVSPKPTSFSEAYLYLTHRPGESVRNEFNFVAGFGFAPETTATVKIGSQVFDLFVESDAAWLDDPTLADAIAGRMRAGSSLTIESTTDQGERVTQTFSLSGITAASRAIDRECA